MKLHFAKNCESLSTIPDREKANYERGWWLGFLRWSTFEALARYVRSKDPNKRMKWI